MSDTTFEEGFDKGTELATQQLSEQLAKQEAEREAGRLADDDAAWGMDPRKQAYLREHHADGDMSIDDWNALNEFLADKGEAGAGG